jgi:hypothetical protein
VTYDWPVYTVRVSLMARGPIVSAFGLEGLLTTIPRLDPDLYTVREQGYVYEYGYESEVATAAVHPNGSWTLNFNDGREYSDRALPCADL